jgi:hypothetical protein
MSDAALAIRVLETIRQSLRLSIGEVRYYDFEQGCELWAINARSADGSESWTAKAEDFYEAVCGLATLVGFELDDG